MGYHHSSFAFGPSLPTRIGLAGGVRGLHGIAGRGVPILQADIDIAVGEAGGQAGEIVGRHIFDVVAELLQDIAVDMGVEVDARPIHERDLDGVLGFRHFRRRGPRRADPDGDPQGEDGERPRRQRKWFHALSLPFVCFPFRVARGLLPGAIFYCGQSSSPAGRPSSRVGLAMVWHWVGWGRNDDTKSPISRLSPPLSPLAFA